MTKINEELQKIAAAISKIDSPNSLGDKPKQHLLPGDPNCPICGGVGYLRQELPVGHPDFGKVTICSCRHSDISKAVRAQLFQISNLNALKQFTFETFKPFGRMGKQDGYAVTISSALNTAREYSTKLNGWLVFHGGYGCGKTHLAAAIANYVVGVGVPTLFITVPDLLDWMRSAYSSSDTTFEERFEEIKGINLLIMDDFGTENATSWAQEKLFQILNYRYVNQLPLIVTTNRDIKTIEGRILSRLKDKELTRICYITAPDYRNPSDDSISKDNSLLQLKNIKRCTFETFKLRKNENISKEDLEGLEDAYKAASKYARNPNGWIVFRGSFSTGKTHLAAAIGNYQLAMNSEVIMVSVPELLDQLRSTFSPSSQVTYDEKFEQYKNSSLLILDDLGTQSATPWAKEKLYQLFNYRFNSEKPTVITLSQNRGEIDERLLARIMDQRLSVGYELNVPAYSEEPAYNKNLRRPRRLGE
jgi:DNA replication protein DnaC